MKKISTAMVFFLKEKKIGVNMNEHEHSANVLCCACLMCVLDVNMSVDGAK